MGVFFVVLYEVRLKQCSGIAEVFLMIGCFE